MRGVEGAAKGDATCREIIARQPQTSDQRRPDISPGASGISPHPSHQAHGIPPGPRNLTSAAAPAAAASHIPPTLKNSRLPERHSHVIHQLPDDNILDVKPASRLGYPHPAIPGDETLLSDDVQ